MIIKVNALNESMNFRAYFVLRHIFAPKLHVRQKHSILIFYFLTHKQRTQLIIFRATEWATAVGRHDLARLSREYLNVHCHLCATHFNSKMLNADKTRLLHHAMPTVTTTAADHNPTSKTFDSYHVSSDQHGAGNQTGILLVVQI